MDQKKNNNWEIIILRSGGCWLIIGFGLIRAIASIRKEVNYGKTAGKAMEKTIV
jgi:hypothetical protein